MCRGTFETRFPPQINSERRIKAFSDGENKIAKHDFPQLLHLLFLGIFQKLLSFRMSGFFLPLWCHAKGALLLGGGRESF